MKKKVIIAISLISLLMGIITIIYISKNNKKYIMQDGMMLAMTITDEEGTRDITTFPERGAYSVEVDCGDTAEGIWLSEEWKLAVENITGKVSCNISFTSNPTTLKNKVESVNTTNNNGYRYSGKSPANWVWFNGEKWRIIGSIPTCTSSGCTTSENLVKIIRAESIGVYTYDAKTSGYTGAWGNNTLYNLLNTYYYATDASAMNGQNHVGCYICYYPKYKPKPNCDYSGSGILSSSYYGKMVKNVYWNTGVSSNNVTPSAAYTNEIATQTVSGHIGLMSTSDWGYAASSTYYSTTMNSYSTATTTSWIFNFGDEWTSIQSSSGTSNLLIVNFDGYLNNEYASAGATVRPVLYLDSSVYIVSGDGSEGNPYQLGM